MGGSRGNIWAGNVPLPEIETPKAPRGAPKARESRRKSAELGRVWVWGIHLPIRLGGTGSVVSSPAGSGRSSGRKRILAYFEGQRTPPV